MATKVPDRASRRPSGKPPVMGETSYDLATSGLTAALVGLGTVAGILIAVWLCNLIPTEVPLVVQFPAGDGGYEDGNPDETLDVDSPEDPSDDPSLSNNQQEMQLEQVLEQVVQFSDNAAALVQPNEYSDPTGGGNPGSAEGNGRPFGTGGGVHGGEKREQRWFVEFAEKGNLKSYAAQLDFFGIELACAFRDGRVYYVRNLSGSPPGPPREARVSSEDQRLFMNWAGNAERQKADIELLEAAGVPTPQEGVVLHFYPTETEQQLAQLERAYNGRQPNEIRQTRFRVQASGGGYEFVVSSQKLK